MPRQAGREPRLPACDRGHARRGATLSTGTLVTASNYAVNANGTGTLTLEFVRDNCVTASFPPLRGYAARQREIYNTPGKGDRAARAQPIYTRTPAARSHDPSALVGGRLGLLLQADD